MTLTIEEIQKEVEELEKESKALRQELYQMAWYMRGALNIEQAFMLDFHDREIIAEIIKQNIEVTKETNMPFF